MYLPIFETWLLNTGAQLIITFIISNSYFTSKHRTSITNRIWGDMRHAIYLSQTLTGWVILYIQNCFFNVTLSTVILSTHFFWQKILTRNWKFDELYRSMVILCFVTIYQMLLLRGKHSTVIRPRCDNILRWRINLIFISHVYAEGDCAKCDTDTGAKPYFSSFVFNLHWIRNTFFIH